MGKKRNTFTAWPTPTACYIIQFPSGTFGYVGAVPTLLAYVDGASEAARTFATHQGAADFAYLHGVVISESIKAA